MQSVCRDLFKDSIHLQLLHFDLTKSFPHVWVVAVSCCFFLLNFIVNVIKHINKSVRWHSSYRFRTQSSQSLYSCLVSIYNSTKGNKVSPMTNSSHRGIIRRPKVIILGPYGVRVVRWPVPVYNN